MIRCLFTIASLDDEPQYEALSYVWGDTSDARFVVVEGRPFSVTASLYSALRHLRLQDQERVLWVDALCINQSDLREKMSQVSLMSRIYGQASQVVVWLSEGWNGSDMALEFLRKLAEDDMLHLDPLLNPSIRVHGLNMNSMELCGNLINLFNLPWWKRIWTIQEFVLAQKLVFQCSRSLITRETLFVATINFWRHKYGCCLQTDLTYAHPDFGLSLLEALQGLSRLEHCASRKGESYNILIGLVMFYHLGVTDPRDRVYGLLGLGAAESINLIKPDYTLSPEQVCRNLAVKSTERSGKLEFLSHLFEHENHKLPSFIPNWTGSYLWTGVLSARLERLSYFSASRDMPADIRLISPGMLATKGIIFDTITATSSAPILEMIDTPGLLRDLYRIAGLELKYQDLYCKSEEPRLVALWRTLCGDIVTFQQGSEIYIERLEGSTDLPRYYKWVEWIQTRPRENFNIFDADMLHVQLAVESASHGRRLFTTKRGYLGLAPQRCKEGDLVVILAGEDMAYILRAISHVSHIRKKGGILKGMNLLGSTEAAMKLRSNQCYNILGDSYVHGIMDGEAFDLVDEKDRKLREILLV